MFKFALTWLRRTTAFGGLVLGVVCLITLVTYWQQQYWFQTQRVNLEHLPADRVLDAVQSLAAEGPEALPELVAALASMQASVATSAQQVVLEQFDQLEAQHDRKSARAKVILAEALARHVLEFGPTMSRFTAQLAERLLREDHERLTSDERMRLIDACGIVITHASRQVDVDQLARSVDLNWQETPQPIPWEETIALLQDLESKREQRLAAHLAGGGVDPDGVDVPALPDAARNAYTSLPSGDASNSNELAPKPLPDVTGQLANQQYERPEKFRKPLEMRRLPKKHDTQVRRDSPPANGTSAGDQPGLLSPDESRVRQAMPSRRSPGRSGSPPRDENIIRLLHALVDADEQAANRAAIALTELGLPKEHLELARRLADPDPAVRKSLVEILPRAAGLDARPWLMWLAQDDHPDVRLAAMSMLATSQDPNLCEQVEQWARNDSDERILALADRLLERRTGIGQQRD